MSDENALPGGIGHARTTDLPGWPCPPRARDIAKTPDSWGWVPVSDGLIRSYVGVVQDELGRLWLNGDYVPKFKRLNADEATPGAIVFWTEAGIGVYIHPKSYKSLGSVNSYDMAPDQWVPIVAVSEQDPSERGEDRG